MYINWYIGSKAFFKGLATAVSSSIDRIKFDFNTVVGRRLKPGRRHNTAAGLFYLPQVHA